MTRGDELYRRYLRLLGLETVSTDLAGLKQVVRRHLIAVPFENVSKRLQSRRRETDIPDLATYLDGIERHRFGGTCYANNYYLYGLLRYLGYDVRLCGADMAHRNDVHVASIVTCEGREYIVDCGFGAPFFEPLAADLPVPQVISLGNERFVVQPRDAAGVSCVEHFEDGEPRYGYALKPAARTFDEFGRVIADSYAPDAFFITTLYIVRFSARGSVALKNRTLARNLDGHTVTETLEESELPGAIQEVFGITADIVREALGADSSHAG
jgi:arylamine N-acetyltransferase